MLQKQSVPPSLLKALDQLDGLPWERGFYLSGGTALALRYGHRMSEDLDFFTQEPFDVDELIYEIREKLGDLKIRFKTKGAFSLTSEDTKIEFFHFKERLLHPPEQIEDVILASLPDNIGMKCAALSERGVKKDFTDLAEILRHYSIDEVVEFFVNKFPHCADFMLVRSLGYFDDAEENDDPIFLNGDSWESVKESISSKLKDYLEFPEKVLNSDRIKKK